jgi:hypothetical protein
MKTTTLAMLLSAISALPAFGQPPPPAITSPTNPPTGPTISLDFNREPSAGNPVASFMYFVPLISPEPVSTATSPGSTQSARVLSVKRHATASSFVVTCEFEFTGAGSQQSIFDLEPAIHRGESQLKAGGSIPRQLTSIVVEGAGHGTVEIEGVVTNRVETISEVRLRFNSRGHPSPVTIGMCEISYLKNEFRRVNEIVARVNTLTFRNKPGVPRMEVTVATVKDKGAGSGLWQSFKGGVKGLAVNLFLEPLPIEVVGNKAMIDFGAALVSGNATFTFPWAKNLKPTH